MDVFPSTTETSFTYYDDDGESYNYENGDFLKQEITTIDKGMEGINVTIEGKEGSFTSDLDKYLVKIHGKAGSNVTLGENQLTSYDDKQS